MKKTIRFLLSGVLCMAVMASAIALVNGKNSLAAAASKAENLHLVAKACNVRFVVSKSSSIKYDYDYSKFSVTTSISGATTNITANKKPGSGSIGSNKIISIDIPDNQYKAITVESENAGVALPELNVNFNLTSQNGSFSVDVPESYSKTTRLKLINGAGSICLKQVDKNFSVSVKRNNSALSIPENWPVCRPNADYSYKHGTGTGMFVMDLKNSAFAISNT